ncbi:ABC transporter substrate-binding protein [Streptomyces beijiangensis]|uniref:ABC transporter substrate-binding protein n=1 Tax=Streptomyces beijiangensis TaxID=163361 RepID=A0A939FEF1_9ACTN|nr:ABC transporter substrate-binding protein [Streptomyces beijiangensis]MBO0517087.1 ABC transporter substrate-binding protein [Streptomyces beijiangensis]
MTASTTRRTTAQKSRIAAVGAIAVAGALLLTACGDQTKSDDTKTSDSSKSSAPLANLLPADVKAKGTVKVGSDIAYAPVESTDASGKTVGIDPDIAEAIGKQLGVKFEFQNGKFADLIAGLAAKRYDIAMSAMTDTKDRQNGIDSDTKQKVGAGVDFVDYFTAGVSIYTNKGATKGIKTWDDLCGKSIGVQTATFSQDLAKAQAKKCTAAGKKTVKIEDFPTNPEAETRMRSKGVDAVSADFPIAAYSVKHSGDGKYFEIVGEQVEAGPYGIALAKGNDKLRDAVQAALKAIIKSGEYDKIIAKWGVEAGVNHDAKINGGS